VVGLILVFVLMILVLAVLLFIGSLWVQDFLYSQPTEQLFWRAPAAAAAVSSVIAFWCFLDFHFPQNYPAPFDFSSQKNLEPVKELWAIHAGKEVHYTQRKNPAGRSEYRDNNNKLLPSRPEAVLILEDGEKVRFDPEKDSQGNYKAEKGQLLRYKDSRGRVMYEDSIGHLSQPRTGLFFGYFLLNALHFAVWFAALWLILRFQWTHALGITAVFWLVMTLLVVPMLITQVEDVARNKPKEPLAGRSGFYHPNSLRASRSSLAF